MPVSAFTREPVHRLTRNLAHSTSILTAKHSVSISFLASVVCPLRAFEKYRARAAYRKNCPIWTKINVYTLYHNTEPHTKFQLSIFIGSPVVVDQSFRGFSGRRSRRLAGGRRAGPGRASARRRGEMPVCAFIREPIVRLSRNLVRSTDIPVASRSLSFSLLT